MCAENAFRARKPVLAAVTKQMQSVRGRKRKFSTSMAASCVKAQTPSCSVSSRSIRALQRSFTLVHLLVCLQVSWPSALQGKVQGTVTALAKKELKMGDVGVQDVGAKR